MSQKPTGQVRQKALQEELTGLVDVVGPGPLVDLLLERAFQLNATDIHLDPNADGLRIRLRVDGLLHDVVHLPVALMSHVISRLKLMADMDITERRVSQDGHISNSSFNNLRDIRIGSGPTIYGERLVLRLMPSADDYAELNELGLDEAQIAIVKEHLSAPYGMVLSVGPVGSGKTTTVYACLRSLNDPTSSLTTIEDPVERRIAGVNQIQVDPKIDFNFVDALRGVLRQDADVMMVGEIRDPETAHISVRAGLTGINVLSTMHANDTGATIDVFRELGVPPMFIADSLNCIISQRLVRRICPVSRETYQPGPVECELLKIDPDKASEVELVRGVPDDVNFHTGYSGRVGVFEVMSVTKEIRDAILQEKSHQEVMQTAIDSGMQTLEESARKMVLAGMTSVEEMLSVMTSIH